MHPWETELATGVGVQLQLELEFTLQLLTEAAPSLDGCIHQMQKARRGILCFSIIFPCTTPVHPSNFNSTSTEVYTVLAPVISAVYPADAKRGITHLHFCYCLQYLPLLRETLADTVSPVQSRSCHLQQISRVAILQLMHFCTV